MNPQEFNKQERKTFFWKMVALVAALILGLAIYSLFVNHVL